MKIFLSIIFFIIAIQSWIKADEISDFKIEELVLEIVY